MVRIGRRRFLQAAGVSLALPYLEAMARDASPRPGRTVFFFVPNGVNMWEWHPREVGADYNLTFALEPLAPFRRELTVFSGLQHFGAGGGHQEAGIWLTGNDRYRGGKHHVAPNTISIDQHIARRVGTHTRIPNLVLSSMGGTNTISFNAAGQAVSADANLRGVFEDLFGSPNVVRLLERRGSVLDAVREETVDLRRDLGRLDRQRLDQYLESVHDVERRVRRDLRWVQTDRPAVDDRAFALDADPYRAETQSEYIRTMLDLMALALETDSTRVIAFLGTCSEGVGSLKVYSEFGTQNWHGVGHNTNDLPLADKPREYAFLRQVDRWWADHLARFLRKLGDAREGEDSLLERTAVLFGSGMSWPASHGPHNLPLLLAGGSKLGIRHGRHLRVNAQLTNPRGARLAPGCVSVSDLLRTISERVGVPAEGFGQSTRVIDELIA